MSGGRLRVVWTPGSDLLTGICHCGAEHRADDPAEIWRWLLSHPRHGDGTGMSAAETVTDVVVAERRAAADGVVSLTLRAAGAGALPAWRPGAHIDLLLEDGLVRQYSLCGDPADAGRWRLAVQREDGGRGGSALVHDRIAPGDRLKARGPRNHFPFTPAPSCLFLAGGIGITPILPMVAAADAAGSDWRLLYGGRSRSAMAFRDELAGYGDRVVLRPQDETGLLDLDAALLPPRPGTAVYCCGPEAMLAAVEERCAGWPQGALRTERFSPKEPSGPGGAFEVELAASGLTLAVGPGRSILETVEAAGVDVLSSCREGICGTCETPVLDGTPDHRDSVLTEEERRGGEFLMICVSRSRTPRLVLDL